MTYASKKAKNSSLKRCYRRCGQRNASSVGLLTNVRSIILSGGGGALYAAAIPKAFPRVTLEVIDSPCTANAKGFLIVGEAGLTRERATAKA